MHKFIGKDADVAVQRAVVRRCGGFTLVELMIVTAIVAILAAIAIPSYHWAVVKARRGNAQGCLITAAQSMERYYTTTGKLSYANAPLPSCDAQTAAFYDLSFDEDPTATAYTLQIVPKEGTSQESESVCGTMKIDQSGLKTGLTDACWN
jgi:type IV pilus assembly protein PilE